MAAQQSPTARRIALGHELREMRKQAGLSIQEASNAMPFSDTKLQRVETGLQDLRSPADLRRLLTRYGVTGEDEIARLLAAQREASGLEWWMPYVAALSPGMPRLLGIESAAKEVQAYHPTTIPALLQTEAYARTTYLGAKPLDETTTEYIETGITVRMKRKEALTRADEPLRLHAILYEPSLRHITGSPNLMHDQYDEITRLAALDNVTVQILPLAMRSHLFTHDFSILTLDAGLPAAVTHDTALNTVAVTDKPRETGRFTRHFTALTTTALPPEDTPGFLHHLAQDIATRQRTAAAGTRRTRQRVAP